MVVKMVVPTFGSLLRIMEPSFLGCIRHGVESEHSGSSGQEKAERSNDNWFRRQHRWDRAPHIRITGLIDYPFHLNCFRKSLIFLSSLDIFLSNGAL
ncbi:hypothetical protein D3C76_752400 [compost metagenome]